MDMGGSMSGQEIERREALTVPEKTWLGELEAVVDRGLQTFFEVGEALMKIRAARLHRETHATFKAYVEERFDFSDARARQLIAAAKTVTTVTLGGGEAPKTEREARFLAGALRGQLQQHPLVCGLLRPIPAGLEWEGFRESVERFGLIVPILLYDGKVLDGWMRYLACLETRAIPKFRDSGARDNAQALERWLSENVYRKHYTVGERACIAVELVDADLVD